MGETHARQAAEEIGRLFRKACEAAPDWVVEKMRLEDLRPEKTIEGTVTDKRKFPRKISRRRNGQFVSRSKYEEGDDEYRYRMRAGVSLTGTGRAALVSVRNKYPQPDAIRSAPLREV
jgi:hypothetical protein